MSDCILWTKCKDKDGYGWTHFNGKLQYIHRVVYAQRHQVTLTPEDVIRHSCDNPSCYNVEHLVKGTHADNARDKVNKGRQAKGEKLALVMKSRKLNESQVRQMRRLYSSGRWTQLELSEVFKVGKSVVDRIVRGENWSWLVGEFRKGKIFKKDMGI